MHDNIINHSINKIKKILINIVTRKNEPNTIATLLIRFLSKIKFMLILEGFRNSTVIRSIIDNKANNTLKSKKLKGNLTSTSNRIQYSHNMNVMDYEK